MNADEQTRESLEEALNLEGGDGQWCTAAIDFIGRLRMQGVKAGQVTYPSFVKQGPVQNPVKPPPYTGLTREQDPEHKTKLREYKLWFGMHNGKTVKDVDEQYLRWILINTEPNGNLHPACRNELRIRGTIEERSRYNNPYRPS